MPPFDGFLEDLALVLITGAVAAVVFQRLRLPIVLGYLLAGLVIGPHVPLPLFADVESVSTLAELGITLLMFSIGLEFSLRKLIELGGGAVFIVALEVALLFWLGFLAARAFGLGPEQSACIGAIVAIASTMVVAKTIGVAKVDERVREFVFGILVVEDLVSMLILALLTALVSGAGLSAAAFASSAARLAAFLAVLVAGGLMSVPRLLRWVMVKGNREATLLAAIGVCFGFAMLAKLAGYSIALGAFIAGTLAAETGHARMLEPLIRPVRDMFAAVFFVATGMMIDPGAVLAYLPLAAALAVVVVAGKLGGLALGGVLSGRGIGPSVRAALWLVPVGEYGFLVAAVGRGVEGRPGELHALAAALCVITVLVSPLLVARSERIALAIERRVSPRLAVFETLYGTWIEALRARRLEGRRLRLGRIAALLVADGALIVAVVIGTSLWMDTLTAGLERGLGSSERVARGLLIVLAALACVPFCIGLARASRRLALLLAEQALPGVPQGALDLAVAPRRSLAAAIQLAALLAVGAPVLAITQPFLPALSGIVAVVLVGAVLGFAFKRRVDDLDGHFRAGSQVVLEMLVRQGRGLEQVAQLLPGLGNVTAVSVDGAGDAVGRTLGDLDLHGRTGATVVCVTRGARGWITASDEQVLEAGDQVAVTGTEEEIALAQGLLRRAGPEVQAP